eukprot:TRINITY_DN10274_c0_g1_i1.p1 TRINITY_DN10274_c0_g1~~TRINITY_DN10274_c0_g1_i1.p1  ORF type:complete len:309 (+),score=36.84 TRINITY_DN10274_c0_g1_i1:66-992(+)
MPSLSTLACGFTRILFKGLAVFCVSVAICIISGTIFTFFHTVFPLVMDLNSLAGCVQFLFASWMSFNLIFNYVMCVKTSAGTADVSVLSPEELKEAEMQQNVHKKRGEGFTLWCHHSDQPKPPRSHFCHVSGVLVLKMDHFCPWVGQCVGHFNHRYFLLFLIYLWSSTFYAVACIGLYWAGFLYNPNASEATLVAEAQNISLCFVVCIALVIAITFFILWSGFLALTNQTTIEFLGNKSRAKEAKRIGLEFHSPFDLGLRGNLQEVFGPFKHYYEIFLPSTTPLVSDGHHWVTRYTAYEQPESPEWKV